MLKLKMNVKKQGGFTLIELIVTIALMGLVIVGLVNLYIMIETSQRKSYHLEIATRAGEAKIESLRNAQYNNLEAGTSMDFSSDLPEDLPSPKTGTVQISEPTSGVKRVDVDITYGSGSNEKVVKQSSLIGVIGIGQ